MADKDKEKNNTNQNLGCLEEDDEFEEFPVEGKIQYMNISIQRHPMPL